MLSICSYLTLLIFTSIEYFIILKAANLISQLSYLVEEEKLF